MDRKTREKILAAMKTKAENLGLKYDKRIFVATFLTKGEVALINYLMGSPRYNRFGISREERIANLKRFLVDDAYKMAGYGGSAGLDKTYLIKVAGLITDLKIKKRVMKLINALKPNKHGYAAVVTKSKKRSQTEIENDILFHEWVHTLLAYNKIGFWDTGKDRWKYNEGLTIFVEYYLGNYYGRDLGFLKDRMEKSMKLNKNDDAKLLKYVDIFVKLVEQLKTPAERRKAIERYFMRFHAPRRYMFA